jgi:hypothetical protein
MNSDERGVTTSSWVEFRAYSLLDAQGILNNTSTLSHLQVLSQLSLDQREVISISLLQIAFISSLMIFSIFLRVLSHRGKKLYAQANS